MHQNKRKTRIHVSDANIMFPCSTDVVISVTMFNSLMCKHEQQRMSCGERRAHHIYVKRNTVTMWWRFSPQVSCVMSVRCVSVVHTVFLRGEQSVDLLSLTLWPLWSFNLTDTNWCKSSWWCWRLSVVVSGCCFTETIIFEVVSHGFFMFPQSDQQTGPPARRWTGSPSSHPSPSKDSCCFSEVSCWERSAGTQSRPQLTFDTQWLLTLPGWADEPRHRR